MQTYECRIVPAAPGLSYPLSEGFFVQILADLSPPAQEKVYWLHQECRKRQPPVETRQTPQDYAKWRETFVSPTANPELYFLLCDAGTPVAVTCLVKTEVPQVFVCGFTGILPAYAGRGLALALKSHALRTAHECGIEKVIAHVRDDNPAMLRLNETLGFTRVPSA